MPNKKAAFENPLDRLKRIAAEMDMLCADQKRAKDALAAAEGELNDLEHEIELMELNAIQLRKRAERIRDVRRARRQAKDALATLDPMMQTFERCGVVKGIQQAAREAELAEKRNGTRQYYPRVRTGAQAKV